MNLISDVWSQVFAFLGLALPLVFLWADVSLYDLGTLLSQYSDKTALHHNGSRPTQLPRHWVQDFVSCRIKLVGVMLTAFVSIHQMWRK